MSVPAVPLRSHLHRLVGWCMLPAALALIGVTTALMVLTYQQQVTFFQEQVDGLAAEVDADLARNIKEVTGDKAWFPSLPTDTWQRLLDRAEIRDGWNVVLLNGNGTTIANRGPDAPVDVQSITGVIRFTAACQQAPWVSVVYASWWTFYQPAIRLAALLILALAVIGAFALWMTRRSSSRLNAALAELADQASLSACMPTGTQPALRVIEIDAICRELQRLRSAEHQAELRDRRRIARELHDGMQQDIAAVKMMVDLARRDMDQPSDSAQLLTEASQITQRVIYELHHVIIDLRPPALDELGLVAALEQLARIFRGLTDLVIEVESLGNRDTLQALPAQVNECVFRLTQECLNNVRQHARATFVLVELDLTNSETLVVEVTDDGLGMDLCAPVRPGSFGHIRMRQRVTALGGTLEITTGKSSVRNSGTSVRATLPIKSS